MNCINHTCDDCVARFTATEQFKGFQESLSIHGVPDVLIRETKQITVATTPTDSSSEDESAIEASFQRPSIKGPTSHPHMPEKLGELIASSYILLVCKLLRKLVKRKLIKEVVVNGLLLDKMLG